MKLIKTAACAVACVLPVSVHAVVVNPDQAIKVEFSLTGVPATGVDAMVFEFRSMNFSSTGFTAGALFQATLMDGSTVLGVDSTVLVADDQRRHFGFVTPYGGLTYDAPAVGDLSSLLDGTIHGSMLLTSSAAYEINLDNIYNNFEFNFIQHSVSFGGLVNNENYAYATSYSIVPTPPVPLPGGLTLFASAASALALASRRRKS
jgi:hypothetical protein